MGPYHFGYYRGPIRTFWFLLGAGAATWWFKHKEVEHHGIWGHCRRPAIHNTPNNLPDNNNHSTHTYPNGDSPPPPPPPFSFKDIPRTINNVPPSSPNWNWGKGERKEADNWKAEQDKLSEIRRQATETMSDMTEATLESILTTAEALRAKLSENRTQRKKQQEQQEQQLQEEDPQNTPRLI